MIIEPASCKIENDDDDDDIEVDVEECSDSETINTYSETSLPYKLHHRTGKIYKANHHLLHNNNNNSMHNGNALRRSPAMNSECGSDVPDVTERDDSPELSLTDNEKSGSVTNGSTSSSSGSSTTGTNNNGGGNGGPSGHGSSSKHHSKVKVRCNCEELLSTECHLETKDLWDKFHDLGTEMIITKTGRFVKFFAFFIYIILLWFDCYFYLFNSLSLLFKFFLPCVGVKQP